MVAQFDRILVAPIGKVLTGCFALFVIAAGISRLMGDYIGSTFALLAYVAFCWAFVMSKKRLPPTRGTLVFLWLIGLSQAPLGTYSIVHFCKGLIVAFTPGMFWSAVPAIMFGVAGYAFFVITLITVCERWFKGYTSIKVSK